MEKYQEIHERYGKLRCSVCGFVPDQEDIDKTDYKINTCDTCGQENVCDICLYHTLTINNNSEHVYKLSKTQCPKCSPQGQHRKQLLANLYSE